MTIHDFPQLSPEWFEARRGMPSASNFGRIITPKTMKLAAAAEEYIAELVGESLSLVPPAEKLLTQAMRHGVEFEAEARRYYEFERDCDVRQVGLCVSDCGRFCCSPDGLIPDLRRGLELKCPQAKTQVQWLLAGVLPDEHKAQVHGSLLVTGFESWDFLSYHPGLPPLLVTVVPDEFTAKLSAALDQFLARLEEVRGQIERRAA